MRVCQSSNSRRTRFNWIRAKSTRQEITDFSGLIPGLIIVRTNLLTTPGQAVDKLWSLCYHPVKIDAKIPRETVKD